MVEAAATALPTGCADRCHCLLASVVSCSSSWLMVLGVGVYLPPFEHVSVVSGLVVLLSFTEQQHHSQQQHAQHPLARCMLHVSCTLRITQGARTSARARALHTNHKQH